MSFEQLVVRYLHVVVFECWGLAALGLNVRVCCGQSDHIRTAWVIWKQAVRLKLGSHKERTDGNLT